MGNRLQQIQDIPNWFRKIPAGSRFIQNAIKESQAEESARRKELISQKREVEKERDGVIGVALEKLNAAKKHYEQVKKTFEAATDQYRRAKSHAGGQQTKFQHLIDEIDKELRVLNRSQVDQFQADLELEVERLKHMEGSRDTKPQFSEFGDRLPDLVVASTLPAIKLRTFACLDARSESEELLLSCVSEAQLKKRLDELHDALPAIVMVKVGA